jgi:hypothetical protein
MQKKTAKTLNTTNDALKSKAMLWESEGDCPQCSSTLETLWFMECCGIIMCDVCREHHDAKWSYSTRTSNQNE